MSETHNLSLPLLAAAQAQKHVTMNEALTRLDALANPSILRDDLNAPPTDSVEGSAYIVAHPATGGWAGHDGQIAIVTNGGWDFATPQPGLRAWIFARNRAAVWTGTNWAYDLVGPFGAGACTSFELLSSDEELGTGPDHICSLTIPDRAVVLGVTGRVLTDLTGSGLTSWRVGVAGSDDRYGSSIGTAAGSTSNGVTGAPVAYYADTPLLISAEGGVFDGGSIRLAVHFLTLTPPDMT